MISLLLRVRLLSTPVTADEGGYLAIARAWGHGRVLYRDVWLDRPQGLLLIYRLWDWVSGGHDRSVHGMAIIFGVVLVASTALLVRELIGQEAARWTAIICGVTSASPVLEGFIPNGELLSGAMVAAGIAVWALGRSRTHHLRWCYASGLLAGIGLSIKQSGFDGLFAIGGCLALAAIFAPEARRSVLRSSAAILAGSLTVLSALMIHAALTGWARWWFAVAGFRSQRLSLLNNAAWGRLRATAIDAAQVLGLPLVLALAIGGVVLFRRRPSLRSVAMSRSVPLLLWFAAATVAFLIGGGYWPHYWLLLCAPISALAGTALATLRRLRAPVAILALVPCLLASGWALYGNSGTIARRADTDASAAVSAEVAHWYLAHRHKGDNLYVMCDSPAIYADIHQDPGVAYLWTPELLVGPHAHQRLIAYLTNAATAPRFIAQVQPPGQCDPSGQVEAILRSSYTPVRTISHATILQRRP